MSKLVRGVTLATFFTLSYGGQAAIADAQAHEQALSELQAAYGRPIEPQLLERLLKQYSAQYLKAYLLEYGKLPSVTGPSEVK